MSEGVQIEEVIISVGRFTKSMRAFGYCQSNSDHTLFLKKQHGKIIALIVYVDDMVVIGNDPEERKALQNYLFREFEMKDLGHLKYFLGIEVSRSSEGIFLSQRKYVLDLLQETGMSGCQPVNTPIEEGLKLCVEPNQVSTDKGRYQRLVGRLMYLAHTRPDLTYALSVVSQYMHNPGEQHMNAVMRILRYLKNAPGKGILFAKNVNHQSIEVYTDADWAGAVDDRRSTSGYFTFVGGNLVTWKSKKQNVVARSSAEVEFRGMALGLCEALWLKLLLQDLGYLSRQPIRLFCDNKAACDIAHNLVQHDRTKHVEVDKFFIKEKLDDKIVELPKIQSEDQLADIDYYSKIKNEESYEESWAKLRIQLLRVNPDCKEKKQRESAMKPILDDSPLLYSKMFLLLTMHEPCRKKGAGNLKMEANFAAWLPGKVPSARMQSSVVLAINEEEETSISYLCEFVKGSPRLKITLNGINFVDHFLNQGAPAEHKSAETPIGHESDILTKAVSSQKKQFLEKKKQKKQLKKKKKKKKKKNKQKKQLKKKLKKHKMEKKKQKKQSKQLKKEKKVKKQ
ncbi:Retrovirus-related Pol polyprotein from transposon RE1 [Vitis vinifera]|uniref:Retrovirus-related Pol polyprotein from transposon RE1 n=1 Tax=Vitis vinifera TaxID=29760 RepID=A0A438FR22_VITVI|nr:Retrovirus-related Pol polyprotein from transposon RE1 [Vitis vinifera]